MGIQKTGGCAKKAITLKPLLQKQLKWTLKENSYKNTILEKGISLNKCLI
jgi:hypothetical protein